MSETQSQTPSPEGGETTKCRYCWAEMPVEAKECPSCGISRHSEQPQPSDAAQAGNKKSGCGASAMISALGVIAFVWFALF